MPPILLGLTGHANAGKDTVASILTIHAGASALAFADGVYQEVGRAFDVSPSAVLANRATKEHPMSCLALHRCMDAGFVAALPAHIQAEPFRVRSPRNILQWWGTEYRRAQSESYWTQSAEIRIRTIQASPNPPAGIVVTDVRFPNEAELIRRLGGFIWKIWRPGSEPAPSGHASEVSGDEFKPDLTILNLHDIRHLQGLVLQLWHELQASQRIAKSES